MDIIINAVTSVVDDQEMTSARSIMLVDEIGHGSVQLDLRFLLVIQDLDDTLKIELSFEKKLQLLHLQGGQRGPAFRVLRCSSSPHLRI